MPLKITAECDLCGAARQEANHWFLALFDTKISRNQGIAVPKALVIFNYKEENAKREGVAILCGEECLHKWVGQNIGRLKNNSAKTIANSPDKE